MRNQTISNVANNIYPWGKSHQLLNHEILNSIPRNYWIYTPRNRFSNPFNISKILCLLSW